MHRDTSFLKFWYQYSIGISALQVLMRSIRRIIIFGSIEAEDLQESYARLVLGYALSAAFPEYLQIAKTAVFIYSSPPKML